MRHVAGTFEGRGGLSLFRQSWYPDDAPHAVLVNLHGLGDHSGLYVAVVEHLVARGIAVHAFDLRGHGLSAGQRGFIRDWSDYREDLKIFLRLVSREAAGLPVFLMGTSLGGLIALEYALYCPAGLRGVIAVSPPLGDIGVPPLLMALGRVLSRIWPRFSLEVGMDLSGLSRDPDVANRILADPLFHRHGTARLSTEVTAAIARTHSLAASLRLPVLLLHGGADRMVPPEGTRAFFARLKGDDHALIEYPDAYHALVADSDSDRVLSDLGAWIEERRSEA